MPNEYKVSTTPETLLEPMGRRLRHTWTCLGVKAERVNADDGTPCLRLDYQIGMDGRVVSELVPLSEDARAHSEKPLRKRKLTWSRAVDGEQPARAPTDVTVRRTETGYVVEEVKYRRATGG